MKYASRHYKSVQGLSKRIKNLLIFMFMFVTLAHAESARLYWLEYEEVGDEDKASATSLDLDNRLEISQELNIENIYSPPYRMTYLVSGSGSPSSGHFFFVSDNSIYSCSSGNNPPMPSRCIKQSITIPDPIMLSTFRYSELFQNELYILAVDQNHRLSFYSCNISSGGSVSGCTKKLFRLSVHPDDVGDGLRGVDIEYYNDKIYLSGRNDITVCNASDLSCLEYRRSFLSNPKVIAVTPSIIYLINQDNQILRCNERMSCDIIQLAAKKIRDAVMLLNLTEDPILYELIDNNIYKCTVPKEGMVSGCFRYTDGPQNNEIHSMFTVEK